MEIDYMELGDKLCKELAEFTGNLRKKFFTNDLQGKTEEAVYLTGQEMNFIYAVLWDEYRKYAFNRGKEI